MDFDRPGLPAIALTTDTPFLTAFTNDFGYEDVFARQVQALGQPVTCCSGSAPAAIRNVVRGDRAGPHAGHQNHRSARYRRPAGHAGRRRHPVPSETPCRSKRPTWRSSTSSADSSSRSSSASRICERRSNDHQPHALSHLLLRRRHRLSRLVSRARRRGAGDDHRQVLLPHLPLPAAVLRAPLPRRLLEDRELPDDRRDQASRRCARCCGSSTSTAASRSITTATCRPAAAWARARRSPSACCTPCTRSGADAEQARSSPGRASTSSRTCSKETVGSQDQVLAAYGGFNHVTFSPERRDLGRGRSRSRRERMLRAERHT